MLEAVEERGAPADSDADGHVVVFGELPDRELFQIGDRIAPRIATLRDLFEAETLTHASDSGATGREIESGARVCAGDLPVGDERGRGDDARDPSSGANPRGARSKKTEEQVETMLGGTSFAHVPKPAIDVVDLLARSAEKEKRCRLRERSGEFFGRGGTATEGGFKGA